MSGNLTDGGNPIGRQHSFVSIRRCLVQVLPRIFLADLHRVVQVLALPCLGIAAEEYVH